jgi:DNA-binding NarL/FixJ family response regulator
MIPQPTRLLIVDDHQIILDSLRLVFSGIENVTIAVTLTDSRQVMSLLDAHEIDVVVSDLHMPHLNGIDLTLQLRKKHPEVKILLLTMAEDAAHIREAIKAGVNGYVLKKSGREELEKAVQTIIAGRKYYSEAVIEELSANASEDYNEALPETILHLTGREIEIVQLIAKEFSSHEIANTLCISVSTIETHRRNLMQKLGVKSVGGVVKYAMRHGLVQ